METGGTPIFGLVSNTFGILGSTVSLVAMVVVSLMTKKPDTATQKMVDESRKPSGAAVISGQR